MNKIIATILIMSVTLFGIELSSLSQTDENNKDTINSYKEELQKKSLEESLKNTVKVFGHNLFNGSFSANSQHRYNPQYKISIGDTINIKMWGAFEFETKSNVDSQGNIFIPKVGIINILGIRNDKLSKTIQKAVKKVFKKSVFVYADLANYQPVSVFVTGAVNKPGLYEGLSSDSVIQFIDKAKGINAQNGSYRKIKILRQNKELKKVDLYSFLLNGSLELFQFHMGDVIVVDSVKNYIEISGDVKRPYRYEMLSNKVSLKEVLKVALANPTMTNFTITKWNQRNEQSIDIYSIKDNLNMVLYSGESIKFIPDHTPQNIEINISGEHSNIHTIVVQKGASLKEIFKSINMSDLSDASSFQLFRKSIATQQKALLEAQLSDLEAKTLTAGSVTTEEAIIRKQEAALVMNFIDRARKVEPKGQIVINKDSDLSRILLEEGDNIFIPKKSYMIVVQGEVMLPGAQTFVEGMSFDEYIESCGGYSFRADDENVLIIHTNGKVLSYDPSSSYSSEYKMQPGDSILVLGKVDSKYLQVIKDITQIIYQIAVGAAVVVKF